MMMELIQLRGNEGGYELLAAYEEALHDLGGRPHWGQVNALTGSHGRVRQSVLQARRDRGGSLRAVTAATHAARLRYTLGRPK